MATFIFRCPATGYRIQGFTAEEVAEDSDTYESVRCTVCQQIHLVNPATGEVAGAKKE